MVRWSTRTRCWRPWRAVSWAALATDVFAQEPPPHDHPLVLHPKVVTTPHVAGATVESKAQLWPLAISQALQVLRGERPPHVVNPEVWPRRRGLAP